ncbi:MAG: DUF2325 domain-containing protein [Rhodocyclales bacterium GT-UBC]|nr:MAG: DUF2325 domain-containing protein [Rhodocyclales bacterium GT-UBC]
MSEFPYHVAGGSFTAKPRAENLAELLHLSAAGTDQHAGTARGSRRRKLWEIPHKFHCPVVGVCFGVQELRTLMAKVMVFPRDSSDFLLHTTAVGACESRSRLADLLHKALEKRCQATIRRFAQAKTTEALLACWRSAAAQGSEIPAALWAAWTHPACDAETEQLIYGDIHMIQHQIGSCIRTDLGTLKNLKQENQQWRQQLAAAQAEIEALRCNRIRDTQGQEQRLRDLQIELAGKDACIAKLNAELGKLRDSLPDLKDRQVLARRAHDAEARASALLARVAEQQEELERQQELARHADETIRHWLASGDDTAHPPEPEDGTANLSGKCILCVGGRSGAVDAYRQIVEQRGGRFLHHDGGLEESLHRIDAALSAADLVVCQAGCISHNAYWRVKEQCKRSGKQCVFIKGAGVSSFGRVVHAACSTNFSLEGDETHESSRVSC